MLRLQAKASCIILPPAREELAAFRRCSASLHAAPLRDPLRIPERAARAAFLRACACCGAAGFAAPQRQFDFFPGGVKTLKQRS